MSKPLIHARSSAKQFGGQWTDYMEIHELMDSSKSVVATNLHRALTHNSWFISIILPRIFGETFVRKSDGQVVSTREIGEQHVTEDFNGFIPSATDFLNEIEMKDWMRNGRGLPPSYDNVPTEGTDKPEEAEADQDEDKKKDVKKPSPKKESPFDTDPYNPYGNKQTGPWTNPRSWDRPRSWDDRPFPSFPPGTLVD